jgi:hypothetical protein
MSEKIKMSVNDVLAVKLFEVSVPVCSLATDVQSKDANKSE